MTQHNNTTTRRLGNMTRTPTEENQITDHCPYCGVTPATEIDLIIVRIRKDLDELVEKLTDLKEIANDYLYAD